MLLNDQEYLNGYSVSSTLKKKYLISLRDCYQIHLEGLLSVTYGYVDKMQLSVTFLVTGNNYLYSF